MSSCQQPMKLATSVHNDNSAFVENNDNHTQETNRLKTFTNCTNISTTVKSELAKLGFYFDELDDILKCSGCIGFRSKADSKEYLKHKCDKADVDIDTDDIVGTIRTASGRFVANVIREQKCKWAHYSKFENRVKSYLGWSNPTQSPKGLSSAGLFYVGHDDMTMCFHCGIGIRNWTCYDDPHIEHARFSPRCNFILKLKGSEFVSKAWQLRLDRVVQQNTAKTQDTDETSESSESSETLETPETPEMREAREKFNGLLTQFDMRQETKSPSFSPKGNFLTESPPSNPTAQSSLDKSFVCKICESNYSDGLYVPCNHLCACYECAIRLKICVICKVPAEDVIKIYRS